MFWQSRIPHDVPRDLASRRSNKVKYRLGETPLEIIGWLATRCSPVRALFVCQLECLAEGGRSATYPYPIKARRTSVMTGGHTALPRSRILSLRVPAGSLYLDGKPIARLISGTCSILMRGPVMRSSIKANLSMVVTVLKGRVSGCHPPLPSLP